MAYEPQTGRPHDEKDTFWQLLDTKAYNVPGDTYLVIAGDFNGHVDGNRCHEIRAFGEYDEGGGVYSALPVLLGLCLSSSYILSWQQ